MNPIDDYSKISVNVRLRPLLESDDDDLENNNKKHYKVSILQDSQGVEIIGKKTKHNNSNNDKLIHKIYSPFDHVFDQSATQDVIFIKSGLKQVLDDVCHKQSNIPYYGTILCYGQTGSGKTYTMSGHEERIFSYLNIINDTHPEESETAGLLPRSLHYIFK